MQRCGSSTCMPISTEAYCYQDNFGGVDGPTGCSTGPQGVACDDPASLGCTMREACGPLDGTCGVFTGGSCALEDGCAEYYDMAAAAWVCGRGCRSLSSWNNRCWLP
jgi:hypothetical protein